MKIATWNVNSVKARRERLLAWLGKHSPDVLCLQETKTQDAGFPVAEVEAHGYHVVHNGQKTYNGVAILSRQPVTDVERTLDGDPADAQARFLGGRTAGVRVLCVYVPNGSEVGSDKWLYKLAWLERLAARLRGADLRHERLVLCGDLNIAPTDDDVARPEQWRDTVLCAAPARAAFSALLALGLHDVVRAHNAPPGPYSFWDYRMLGFPKNNGLRLDHVLATEPLSRVCSSASVDRDERKGESPSDHAPVVATFELA